MRAGGEWEQLQRGEAGSGLLDRDSHYGTTGDCLTVREVRVWASATYTILDSHGATVVPEQTMGAEINSTGRVVYGEQFTFDTAGTYTVEFESAGVNLGTAEAADPRDRGADRGTSCGRLSRLRAE